MRLIISLILIGLLTACTNSVLAPTRQIVRSAIALQLEQTQQQLNQQLDLNFQGFKINHLSINSQKLLTRENLPTFHVQGTYDLTMNLPKKHLNQPQKPFDIYLQLQKEGKTWRLLQQELSQNTQPVWRSYLIQ